MRFIKVPPVDYEKLSDNRIGESSSMVQARVEAAQARQRRRFSESANSITCNADMRPAKLLKHCQLDGTSQSMVRSAIHQLCTVL